MCRDFDYFHRRNNFTGYFRYIDVVINGVATFAIPFKDEIALSKRGLARLTTSAQLSGFRKLRFFTNMRPLVCDIIKSRALYDSQIEAAVG